MMRFNPRKLSAAVVVVVVAAAAAAAAVATADPHRGLPPVQAPRPPILLSSTEGVSHAARIPDILVIP